MFHVETFRFFFEEEEKNIKNKKEVENINN